MKIVILGLNDKRKTGLESWKNSLITGLKNKNIVVEEVYTKSFFDTIKKLNYSLRADICHSYSQSPGTIFIMFIRRLFNKKNIHTIHGEYNLEQEEKRGLKKICWIPFNKICNMLANKITFPSKYLKNRITLREKYISSKSKIIPNGINIEKISNIKGMDRTTLNISKDDFFILEVTNFNINKKAKGIDLLVKEFKQANIKNKKLVIVGNGKYYDKYKIKYTHKNILFLGFRSDVLNLIKVCDLFVHYSHLDTFSMVILEAMAMGKKIIAKGCPVFKEILEIKEDTKIKLDKKSAKKYNHLLTKYDINNVINQFIQEYNYLLNIKNEN
jgi:glycosyltransferase involved in cell wall biosynthesis